MEEFFRKLATFNDGLPMHEVLSFEEVKHLFREHGMEITGPPIGGENWKVENGRILPG